MYPKITIIKKFVIPGIQIPRFRNSDNVVEAPARYRYKKMVMS